MVGGMDDMASTVGVMQALRTGNPIVDMLIAMAVPMLFKMIMDSASGKNWSDMWRSIVFFWSPYYTRDIEHKIVQTSWGGTFNQDRDLRNNVLIKAIQLYLDDKGLEYRNANVMLMSTKQESTSIWADSDDEGENTAAGKLKRFKVARKPPKNRWSLVTGKGEAKRVELMVVESETDKGEKAEKTQLVHVYHFRSPHKGAIDAFVDTCYTWYIAELKKQEDSSRYLYEMQINPGKSSGDDDGAATRVFKRYKLSDEKQFGSLFFDEKEKLLALLRHFMDKTGKYAVQGYPHKLGLLLHGPPGTVCRARLPRRSTRPQQAPPAPPARHGAARGAAPGAVLSRARRVAAPTPRPSPRLATRAGQDEPDQGARAVHPPLDRQRAPRAHRDQPGADGHHVRSAVLGDGRRGAHQARAPRART